MENCQNVLLYGLPASGLTEYITLLSARGWILSDPSLNLVPQLWILASAENP